MNPIPFFQPSLVGGELEALRESLASKNWSGDGPFSSKCSELLGKLTGCPTRLVPSGTHALELAVMALDLQPGDEVILPSFTFPSTATCLVQNKVKPVFIDIREDTLNLDERLIEPALSERTRALMVVHYAGVAAEMDSILAIAKKHRLAVIEDAAHGVNAFYKGRALGSLGDLGAFSFHQTKNFTCGEGGAVVVRNEEYLGRIEIHRQKGTDRSRFLRGQVAKYSWIDRGSSYLLSDLLAAFLYAQLKALETITQKRKDLFHDYLEGLGAIADGRFALPQIPEDRRPNYHLFHIVLKRASDLEPLREHLKAGGVETATHYVPLHSSQGGKRFGVVPGTMAVTEKIENTLLRLPLYPGLSRTDQDRVCEGIKSFYA